MDRLRRAGPYLIFVAAMLWATDAPFRLHLTKELSSNFIVLVEHFFDVLIVLPLLWMSAGEFKKLSARQWLAITVIAVGGSALASIAFTQAFHYVNPSVAILLQKLQPLIVIALAVSLLREKLHPRFWVWAVVGLGAAYLISFPHLAPHLYQGEQFNPNVIGVGYALIAVILWGASTVFGKYALSTISFKAMTTLRFCLAFIFLLILNFAQHTIPHLASVTGKDWLFILATAVTSGVVSLFIYYRGLQYTKASIATFAELGFPVAAVFVNWIFLKEGLAPLQLLGMAILLFAVFQLSRVNASDSVDNVALSRAE